MSNIRALIVLSFVLTACGSHSVSAQVSPTLDASERTATHAPTPLGAPSASEPPSTDNVPVSSRPAEPSPSSVVPPEAEVQGSPTGSPNYLRDNFGIPERLSDCDKAVEPVTADMTEPVRDLTIKKNQVARDACRSSWQEHQVEILQQRAVPAPNPELAEDTNAETALAESEPDKEQPAACARDEKALEDVRDAVAKGDTAYAKLLLDNMIQGGPIDAQNEVDGNTKESATTPRP